MEELDLTLSGHAYLGASIGRDEQGRVIFVPFSIPGERVRVEITEPHKRWARAKILNMLHASPHRVEPRCQHFMDCGGCHYQHLNYEMQLQAKSEVVRDQLQRIGGFSSPPLVTTLPSPSPWNYRNHIQFSLNVDGNLGYHAARSDRVVTIKECHLPLSEIVELWPMLHIPAPHILEQVAIRVGNEGERMIELHSNSTAQVEMEIDIPSSVVWMTGQTLTVLAGEPSIQIDVLNRTFHVSAGSFFQVNTDLASDLVALTLEILAVQPTDVIFDLYAGVGLFSSFIAETGARVIAVEQSAWATKDFEINLQDSDNVELYEAPVEVALPAIRDQPDKILVDPPRGGLGPAVIQAILDHSPAELVYVSCDPTTLARDGKGLKEGGYQLENIRLVDLFPQTYHIETISLWRK
jgi:23S rRNA (uracil1939-C5)-methyltransferase